MPVSGPRRSLLVSLFAWLVVAGALGLAAPRVVPAAEQPEAETAADNPDEGTVPEPLPRFVPPVQVNGSGLSQPLVHGLRAGAGELHAFAGVAAQYRSNVFYETTGADPCTLELVDAGVRFTWPPADAAADAADERHPPRLVLDYAAQFQIFNRFHELNFIEHHGLAAGHLALGATAVDLRDRLGTRHEPETAELGVLTVREIQAFYHDFELAAVSSLGSSDEETAAHARMAAALTLDNRRYQGTRLNFAEYDAYGATVAYEDPRLKMPWGADPLLFKLAIKGVAHPTRILNNLVLYQLVAKSGGALVESAVPGVEPWDVEFALGAAVIDLQTRRRNTGEQPRDALLPVVALQVDGDLNSKQYIHFRLRVAHEPDQSFRANFLRRTTIAATLLQRLSDSYEWEVRATQTWEDPSKGATLSQFEVFAEGRWYKEFPRWYLGRHAPLYLRVETRQIETVERNVTGVKTFGDTRVTAGWALVL